MSKSGKECKFVSDLVKGVNNLKRENPQIQSLINEINADPARYFFIEAGSFSILTSYR